MYSDIRFFERQLRDSGTIILNFSEYFEKEQSLRLQSLRENPNTSWRVDDGVLARHYKYDDYKLASKRCLKRLMSKMELIGR